MSRRNPETDHFLSKKFQGYVFYFFVFNTLSPLFLPPSLAPSRWLVCWLGMLECGREGRRERRERERESESESERATERKRQRDRHRERERERQTDKQTDRESARRP